MIWRQRAIENLYRPPKQNLHYTAQHTLARKDIERLRAYLLDAIEEMRAIIEPSPEEELVCFNLDFFEV